MSLPVGGTLTTKYSKKSIIALGIFWTEVRVFFLLLTVESNCFLHHTVSFKKIKTLLSILWFTGTCKTLCELSHYYT